MTIRREEVLAFSEKLTETAKYLKINCKVCLDTFYIYFMKMKCIPHLSSFCAVLLHKTDYFDYRYKKKSDNIWWFVFFLLILQIDL